MCYKEATREFADRKWWRFLKHSTSAVLDPMLGFRNIGEMSCCYFTFNVKP